MQLDDDRRNGVRAVVEVGLCRWKTPTASCRSEDGVIAVQIVGCRDGVSESLLLRLLADSIGMDSPRRIAQIVEQFEYRKRLVPGPAGQDEKTDRER